jgi:hypothetical protein
MRTSTAWRDDRARVWQRSKNRRIEVASLIRFNLRVRDASCGMASAEVRAIIEVMILTSISEKPD